MLLQKLLGKNNYHQEKNIELLTRLANKDYYDGTEFYSIIEKIFSLNNGYKKLDGLLANLKHYHQNFLNLNDIIAFNATLAKQALVGELIIDLKEDSANNLSKL